MRTTHQGGALDAPRTLPKCSARYVPSANAPAAIMRQSRFNPTTTGKFESSTIPTAMLKAPHRKLRKGDEFPTPLGFANGVGNGVPCNPAVRCGMELQRKAPAKNSAT